MWRRSSDTRVGILRTALDKGCAHLCDRYAQWLAAENEKISAVLQISFDRLPGIGGDGRAVRKHQQLGVRQRARGLQSLQVQEGGMQRRGEGGAIQRLAGNCGEARLPEDDDLSQRRKERNESNTTTKRSAGIGPPSALELYIHD